MLHRLRACGGTGTGGVVMVTEVVAVACLPRSSTTVQVMLMGPGGAPVVFRVAVGVLLAISPAEAEYEYVRVRFWGLLAIDMIVEGSPGITVLGLAEQVIVGG